MAKKKVSKRVTKKKISRKKPSKKSVKRPTRKKTVSKKKVISPRRKAAVKTSAPKKSGRDISNSTVAIIMALFLILSVIGTVSIMDMDTAETNSDAILPTVFGKISLVVGSMKSEIEPIKGESKVRITVN